MATLAEIEAAIAKAEGAGKADLANQLRVYADQMKAVDTKRVAAAIAKAEAAGRMDLADQLRAAAPTAAGVIPAAPAMATPPPPAAPAPAPVPAAAPTASAPTLAAPMMAATPPRALSESEIGSNLATDFAGFEMFNPELAGRYTPETMPAPGDVVMGAGGGGRSGGARVTVRDWRGKPSEQFGDTFQAVTEGPIDAMQAFGGGLTGGPSPSRDYLAKDPLTSGLPGPVLTGLGAIGDIGGAGLSALGAGIAGGIGLATELVPGQTGASRENLAGELIGMSQFAVPELAGVSSFAGRAAAGGAVASDVSGLTREAAAVQKAFTPRPVAPKPPTPKPAAATAPAPAAKAVAETPEAVAALVRKASQTGMGAVKAQEELAAAARLNPEAKAAADRLGIELPADVFSDNEMVKAAAGLTRSEVGKEPEALWRGAVKGARDKADEIMAAMDGSPDIASVSDAVKSSLQATQAALKSAAKSLYDEVDAAVPKSAPAEVTSIVRALNGVVEDLGGVKGMVPAERALYDLVTNAEQPATYGRLLREKSLIGKAIARGDSPYSSMDGATLNRMYGAIAEDQLATVSKLGDADLRAKLREANQLTAKQKGLEKRIVNAFGSDLDGSIGAKLRSAVAQASKGDTAGLTRLIKVIPEDLRKQAIASALSSATRSARATEPGFGLSEFVKTFGGIKANKPIHLQIAQAIGPEAAVMLDDLLTVAKRITSADSNVLRTGKANQVLAGAMQAEGIIGRVLHSTGGQRVVQAAAGAVGAAAGGTVGAMIATPLAIAITAAKPETLALAGKMFASDAFMKMAIEAAEKGKASPQAVARVKNSPQFKAWVKSARIGNPDAVLDGAQAAAPIAAQEAANSNRNPEYDALLGRYK